MREIDPYEADVQDLIRCPECEEESVGWRNTETGCEDCGSHPAVECPKCGEHIDLIFNTLSEMMVTVAA